MQKQQDTKFGTFFSRTSNWQLSMPVRVLILIILFLPVTSQAESTTPMTEQFGSKDVSLIQTGYRVFDIAVNFSRVIELVADEIDAKTDDPEIRRQTLLWKLNATGVINLTSNHLEPIAASIDLWAMASQMTDYYTNGKGKTTFGKFQPLVVKACRSMESQIKEITRGILAPKYFKLLEPELKKWVENHPFEDPSFIRESIIEPIAYIFSDRPSGIFSFAGNMEVMLALLQARLDIYVDSLPRRIRWQSELLALGLADDLLDPRLDTLYQTIAKERSLVLAEIDKQREIVLKRITFERTAALNTIIGERKAMINSVEKLTEETVIKVENIVQAEREIILQSVQQTITDQRTAVMEEINTLQKDTLQEFEAIVTRSIDYTLMRLVAGCIIAYFVLLLTVIFLLRGSRKN